MDKTRTRTDSGTRAVGSGVIRIALLGALYCFGGYLCGRAELPFGAYPFGIALLAAADKNAIFVFAGLAIASFGAFEGGSSILLFGIYAALLLLRVLVRLTLDAPQGKKSLGELWGMLFEEQTGYRVCSAALAAFGLSLAVLVAGGFLYYDLFGLLVSTAVAPLGTYILGNAFSKSGKKPRAWLYDVGWAALFAFCMLGARLLQVYGVSLAVAGGILLVFIVCRKKGFVRGILLGTLIGLVYSPALCPIFLIPALAFGAFARFSTTLVSFSAFFASLGYSFYVSGIHALGGTLGGILAACLGFSVYVRVSSEEARASEEEKRSEKSVCRVLYEGELDGVRLADMNLRMSAMSESLSSISELFEAMELKFPRDEEIRGICARAFEASCVGCAEYPRCKSDIVGGRSQRLAAILDKKGELCESDLDEELLDRCGRVHEIIEEINYNFGIRFRYADKRESFGAEGECLDGYGYKLISELLAKGLESGEDEYAVDLCASAALCDALSALECEIEGVLVYGKRQKRVYLKGRKRDMLESAIEQICQTVKSVTGIELDSRNALLRRCTKADEGYVELRESKRFSLGAIKLSEARGGAEASGDSVAIFENSDGMSFVCMSDGMGSGSDAARTSELAVGFLRNMLLRGRVSRELLSMLNSFLAARCSSSAKECSATLDLLELDCVSGEATFYKCGAAPTYLCHGANLFKLRSRTMPLGILGEPDIKELHFTLGEGDLIVMMSDGVSGGREDCPYLFDLLRQNATSSGDARTAELIMKYARSNSEPDDTTVIVSRVKKEA